MRRKSFVKLVGATALLGGQAWAEGETVEEKPVKIDREVLVARHKITFTQPDPLTPLSVGNSEFAFTADVTGLQTFPDFHEKGMLLGTMAQWAWHTTPTDHKYKLSDTFNPYEAHGRQVPYPSGDEAGGGFGDGGPAASWLNANPHKFDLGRMGLVLPLVNGQSARIEDLTAVHQELDLWQGLLSSQFTIVGKTVKVETVAHPTLDLVAVRITSDLIDDGTLSARLHFPYAPVDWRHAGDWNQPDRHTTEATTTHAEYRFARQIDKTTRYSARVAASQGAAYTPVTQHEYTWKARGQSALSLVVAFSPDSLTSESEKAMPSFEDVRRDAARHWRNFWSSGGAIDLSASTDSRWKELERRIVLSQYQTAVHSAGSLPPQETGLVQNSWFGNSTSKCTGGTPRTSRNGAARIC